MLNSLVRNQQGRMPNWLGVVIILVIIVAIGLIVFWMNRPAPEVTPSATTAPAIDKDITLPDQAIYSISGTIKGVSDKKIQVLVEANNSRFETNKLFMVNYDQKTLVTRRTLPKAVAPGEQVIIQPAKGDVSDLITNVDVIITSDTDIRDKDEFYATRIEVRDK